MLFDTHAHLDDKAFKNNRNEIINQLKENDVSYVLNVGTDLESSKRSIELSKKYDFFFASVGIHPFYKDARDEDFLKIEEMLNESSVVAVGEIGLDYHYKDFSRELQIEMFEKQLHIAKKANKPVIVHDRDSKFESFEIIKNAGNKSGVFHCFSGSLRDAKLLLNYGFYISFTGVITFKNAKELLDIVRYCPIDRILLETDCPYLAPEPFRGKTNDSRLVKYVAKKVAEIKKMPIEEIAKVTTENAKSLFKIQS